MNWPLAHLRLLSSSVLGAMLLLPSPPALAQSGTAQQSLPPPLSPSQQAVAPQGERKPAALPVFAPELLAKFPPALLLAGTQNFALSSTARTHAALGEHHVVAELHAWKGFGHAFVTSAALPESREAYGVVSRFLGAHLSLSVGPRR